ncbi:MAG: phosphoesterase [Cyclobacteriaceae bacterium]|nr:MAG: phosphoesterase [Cyclobacteriaceae bacterium]
MQPVISAVVVFVVAVCLLALDIYLYQPVRVVSRTWQAPYRYSLRAAYWAVSVFLLLMVIIFMVAGADYLGVAARNWIIAAMFVVLISKAAGGLIVLTDDLQRGVRWLFRRLKPAKPEAQAVANVKKISRSEFLSRAALLAASAPFTALSFGILSGAYDYRLHRVTIKLPNLPQPFDGLRIGQISDIHSGSFFNKTAVNGGVDMLLAEKPDVVFFTGDLVNNQTDEINDYLPIFSRIRAPLGVFSVTGNHDYGNYRSWPSQAAKRRNFENLLEAHRFMGFDLLMNEYRMLKLNGEQIAVIGVENWGTGRFPRYGDLPRALKGTEAAPVKLLLSHDPSHWDAQIRPDFPDVDITFAGHTHGFQFGIEWGNIRWSPSQYVYRQWAGLYREGRQYLYVNRGFGFIGYPGRIGILPELTVVELKRA